MVDSVLHLGRTDSLYHKRLASEFADFFDDPDIVVYSSAPAENEFAEIFDNDRFERIVTDTDLDNPPLTSPDTEYLQSFEERYGPGAVWRCLSCDRTLVKRGRTGTYHVDRSPYSHEELLCKAESRARVVSELFERYEFDFVYGQNFGSLGGMIAHVIAADEDIPFCRSASTRVSDRFAIHTGVFEDSDRLLATKNRVETKPETFPIEAAEEHMEAVRNGAPAYTRPTPDVYDELQQTDPRWQRLPDAVREYLDVKFGSTRRGQTPALERKYRDVFKRLRRTVQAHTVGFDEFDPDQSFVYFPLHAQPEISLMVWARYFTDQEAVVRNVAQSLPVGMELYVNEHPVMEGGRPSAFYDELRRLPNVRVISRSVDSGRIIDGAAALVTISSTAGLEALIRGVPVLTLGRPGYRRLDTVHEIDDYDELPQAILRATRTGVDTAEVRAYVATALAYGVPRGHPEFPRKMCEQIDESLHDDRPRDDSRSVSDTP